MAFAWLIDLVYPRKCVLCRQIPQVRDARFKETGLCPYCLETDYRLSEEEIASLPQGISCCFRYEDRLRDALMGLKYEGLKESGVFFARWMVREGRNLKDLKKLFDGCDLIVPVPLSEKRKRERGYNQAAVIGEEIGRLIDKPCLEVLQRVKDTKAQKNLGEIMRRRNLAGAFAPDEAVIEKLPEPLAEKDGALHLLLLDDIYTTGATLESAKTVLENRFPKAKICCLTFAMAHGLHQ